MTVIGILDFYLFLNICITEVVLRQELKADRRPGFLLGGYLFGVPAAIIGILIGIMKLITGGK